MAKLKDLGIIITGNTPKTSEPLNYNSNDILFVKPSDIADNTVNYIESTEYYISEFARNKARIIPKNSVLVTCIGIIGKIAINKIECSFNQQLNAIIPNSELCLPEYLAYMLYCKKHILQSIANAPVVPILNKSQFSEIEIELPTLSEQLKIIKKLKLIDKIINDRKHQLQKLDELVKARFVEMFGDPVTNSKRWKTQRFDSLCENLDYRRKPITASERESGLYPYYGASGIVDYVADYIFDEDILLISEDGANLLMRSTPIAFSVSGKVWVNNHAHVVRFEKKSMQKYIEVFFSLIDISDHITGSAQPKLNQAKLNALMFPVPNEDRLELFLAFVEQIDKSKFTVQQSLEKLETLKKALMQKYFG